MTVPLVPVRELAEQVRGVTYTKGEASATSGLNLVPILRAGNINDNGLNLSDLIFVPESRVAPKQRIRRNDILIATSSGSLDVVGKAAQARVDFQGSFGAFCKVLRPNSRVEPRYFSHYFRTPAYRAKISSLAGGANINNLRNEHLDNLEVPLPPIDTQRRIAEVLDRADELRTKRREALVHLDDLTKSIFLDMFGDPAANSHDWPVTPCSEVCSRVTVGIVFQPASYYQDAGIPALRSLNIQPGKISLENVVYFSPQDNETRLAKTRVRRDDVVLVRTGRPGTAAVVPEHLDGANSIDILITTPKKEQIDPIYLCAYFNSRAAQEIILGQKRGQIQQHLNVGSLRSVPIPLPPLELQREFRTRVQRIDEVSARHHKSLSEVDALFTALQNQAFQGAL
ncbi:restriction endonuclease subunit S [Verrucosispora sp. WMMA2044]|uniref:restriction endonuclease subunit S n=1 Tax=Verrucosispora sp. WMMA2044 TaxID=3016419 RepID=UPI00248BD278|nr:restriction endonuclease subunit S [Verrucosispora sp. WMMA2044]WBB49844.1 restriction endonuclease subunit S [Verrucosispora sp. WMMA2044]